MRWSPEPPSIDPLDGFQKTDIFGLEPFGERLANFVGTVEDDPVLLIDGPWGSGKTTFVAQWEGLLRQRGHAVLHLDAFLSDHYGEPFLPLTEGVHRVATQENLCGNAELVEQFQRLAVAAATELCWNVLASADPAFGPLLRLVKAAVARSRQDTSVFRGWLEGAAKRRKAVKDFRRSLEQLARECARQAAARAAERPKASATLTGEGSRDTRFVFVVDELDRCRPRFAVAMLERIKHVFGVKGVTFVLVANVEELSKSVEREYGRIDSKRYLEKFYDLRVQMPEKTRQGDSWTGKRYVEHLVAHHSLLTHDEPACDALRDVLGDIAVSRELSLRSVEHIFRNVLVLAAGTGQHLWQYPKLGALIAAVRVLEPGLFRKLVDRGQCEKDEKAALADLLDPTGCREEDALQQVEGNLGEYAALPVLARALDGFDLLNEKEAGLLDALGALP